MSDNVAVTENLPPPPFAECDVPRDIVPSQLGKMMLSDIRRGHINQFGGELITAGRAPSRSAGFWPC